MPTPTKGPRLGGSPAHERLLLANLATALFQHGRIKTTEAKAKRLRPYAEKIISKAKAGDLHNRREIMKVIRDKDVVHKLIAEIGPFFSDRSGGYTRITKTLARKGDNAPMAIIELIGEETVSSAASGVARASANRGDRAARVAASAAAAGTAVDAPAEDAPDRESGSTQAVEAATEAPAEGAEVVADEAVDTTEAAAEDAPDRDSASDQAVEAATEAPAEGADDATAK